MLKIVRLSSELAAVKNVYCVFFIRFTGVLLALTFAVNIFFTLEDRKIKSQSNGSSTRIAQPRYQQLSVYPYDAYE
ncbi:hypothetical protein KSF78_0003876 [Schistosoma japonicum]|nr:hypothetical protein KSF78_0003876 [Schistosoma japonicum]